MAAQASSRVQVSLFALVLAALCAAACSPSGPPIRTDGGSEEDGGGGTPGEVVFTPDLQNPGSGDITIGLVEATSDTLRIAVRAGIIFGVRGVAC